MLSPVGAVSSDYHRLIWCPYIPDNTESSGVQTDDCSMLMLVTHDNIVSPCLSLSCNCQFTDISALLCSLLCILGLSVKSMMFVIIFLAQIIVTVFKSVNWLLFLLLFCMCDCVCMLHWSILYKSFDAF